MWAVEITETHEFIGFVGLAPDQLSPWGGDQIEDRLAGAPISLGTGVRDGVGPRSTPVRVRPTSAR